MKPTPISSLTIPLGRSAHRVAREFAVEQETPQKGKQVYLNTLAVYALHNYFNWLQIDNSLNESDSWNPGIQAFYNVADLVIPGLGKIECCPLLPGQAVIDLSQYVQETRICYVAVQFELRLNEAILLGFFPAINIAEFGIKLSLTDIQPLDDLIVFLHGLQQADNIVENTSEGKPTEAVNRSSKREERNITNLLKWRLNDLVEAIDEGWQTIDELFGMRSPAFLGDLSSYAKDVKPGPDFPTIQQGKSIILGTTSLALLVKLSQESEGRIDILVRVFPIQESTDLPEPLKLMVLNEEGDILEELTAGRGNNCLEQPLSGEPGEGFVIKLEWGEVSATESFII
ncbi:DUF1822 family protein [Laspinema olomoucense]|uniref:DUF1822 family protein n=1 Tax=Laspinema olomoucense D3b TaxID=2953688 RepID=A0ABT2NEA5_9CYAN|nr:DUF1822 family protein [Laspinema sp. D3b]MCT7979670.1 DUF1822 family protein [Laspinema sp. D3b]